jgi:DNA-binding NarL/FixJ family response regulator
MKGESDDFLMRGIREVLAGKIFVSPALNRELIQRIAFQDGASKEPIATLSDRELEVLGLIGQGQSSAEIAEKLHISVKTVESHRLRIREKLGLAHALELTRFAVQWAEEQKGLKSF